MFFTKFEGLQTNGTSYNCAAFTYFAFTTLSTVGLGDFYPVNATERAVWSVVLLSGVLVFSYIMGSFLKLLDSYKLVEAENEDSRNLLRFFGLMKKFNNNQSLKKSYVTEIEDFFDHYWSHDKLTVLHTNEDIRIFMELPNEIKCQIFKNFLFNRFVRMFRQYFQLPKNKQQMHSYWKWSDDIYCDFMISMLKSLNPRFYHEGDIIYEEL